MASETVGIVLSSFVLIIILSVVIYYIIKYARRMFGSGLAGTRPARGKPQRVSIPLETLTNDKNDALFRRTLQTTINHNGRPTFVPISNAATIITDSNGTQYYEKETQNYPFDETGTRKAEYPFNNMGKRNVSKYIKQREFPRTSKRIRDKVQSGLGQNMIARVSARELFPTQQTSFVRNGPIDVNALYEPEFTQREIIELFNPSSLTTLTQKLNDYDVYAPHTSDMLGTIKEERRPLRRLFTRKK